MDLAFSNYADRFAASCKGKGWKTLVTRSFMRALDGKLDQLLDEFARDRTEKLDDMIDRLRGLAERVDMRWDMSTDKAEIGWHRDADEADNLGNFFSGRARRILDARPYAIAEATPLLDACAMASGLRIGALALSGEMAAAISVAQDDALKLERLTGSLGAADLARSRIAAPDWKTAPGTEAAVNALALMATEARNAAAALRAREAVVLSRAAPLISLKAKNAHAREWLGAAREEKEAPLLLMMG